MQKLTTYVYWYCLCNRNLEYYEQWGIALCKFVAHLTNIDWLYIGWHLHAMSQIAFYVWMKEHLLLVSDCCAVIEPVTSLLHAGLLLWQHGFRWTLTLFQIRNWTVNLVSPTKENKDKPDVAWMADYLPLGLT